MLYSLIPAYDLFAISETLFNDSIKDGEIYIEGGFSKEIFHSDHPKRDKVGGVCLYVEKKLPIKRRKDLKILQETVISKYPSDVKRYFLL